MENNKLLIPSQFGFRQGLNTTNAIYNFIHETLKRLHNKENPVGIFCDLSKAFDSVDHEILINKLSFYGIKGLPLSWFKSYLMNRSQVVKINHGHINYFSDQKTISKGVPQVSILGPLLFIIYVNDLADNMGGAITQFADDTSLVVSNKSQKDYLENIENTMA